MNTRSLVLRAIPSACLLIPSGAAAQEVPLAGDVVIDGGTVVVVPGTQPSPWNIGAKLFVGDTGKGTLNIGAGGVVSSAISYLGNRPTGIGYVDVSGAGANWTNSSIQIGGNWLKPTTPGGQGTVNISNGGTVVSGQSWIGSTTGSIGTVTVTGTGSSWTVNGNLPIGPYGAGSLIVENGARMSNGQAQLGVNGGQGTVIARGGGTVWTSSAGISVVNGSVTVENGARADSKGTITNDGTITVTGANTVLDNADFAIIIGSNKNATLTIESGATVSGLRGRIGANADSSATVSGGSRWDTSQFFRVGESARGTLTISDGSTVTTGVRPDTQEAASIGTNAGGQGLVTVTGANSKWLNSSILTVGSAGAGTLNALNDAAVQSAGGSLGEAATGRGTVSLTSGGSWTSSAALTIGKASAGNNVTVTGTGNSGIGSNLAVTGALTLGDAAGTNALSLSKGGTAQASAMKIGLGAVSSGNSLTVDGAGSALRVGTRATDLDRSLSLGASGDGNLLRITDGGRVEVGGALEIGSNRGADGNRFSVSGKGSIASAAEGFAVGKGGADNTVLISDGARLTTGGLAAIGRATDDNRVDVAGAGSSWAHKGDLAIGSAGGKGNLLAISGGATVRQTNGSTTVGDGNLLDVGPGSTFTTDGKIAVETGSRLSLGARARVNGGSLSMAQGSQLDVFAQENNSSLVTLSGQADLGGTLNALIDGRSSLSHRFLVLKAGHVNGVFENAVLDDYSANLDWSVFYTPAEVYLQLEAQIADIPGLNENQQNVADSLDDFFNRGGELPPSFLPIFDLNGGDLGQALSQLSGEVGASGGAAATASANTSFLRSMLDHPCTDDHPKDSQQRCRNSVWAAGFGSTASLPGNDAKGSHDTTTSVAGIATGWDHADGDMRVGVAIAGGGTGWNLDGSGMGSGDGTFLQLGAYGTRMMGKAYASFAGAYALQAMSTQRRVTALENERLEADVIGNAVAGRGEAGYRFGTGDHLGVTPYAALQGQAIHTPAYDETGTLEEGSYALSYDATTTTAVRSELGLGLDMATDVALFSARAAWAHDWLNDAYARAGFQSLQGTSFVVNGAEAPADLALVSASANVALSRQAALTARFDGEFGSDYQSYAGTLALTWSW